MTNTVDKKDKVLDKVRKMLALAGNNPSEEEAESALLMAQRMLAKYGLTMEDAKTVTAQSNVAEEFVTGVTRTPWWHKALADIIAKNFKCKAVLSMGGGYSQLKFIGLEKDLHIAREVFQYALHMVNTKATQYVRKVRNAGQSTQGVRNDYINGFLKGLGDKFAEQLQSDESLALAIIMPQEVSDFLNNIALKKARATRVISSGNLEAKTNGYTAGKSFVHVKGNIE